MLASTKFSVHLAAGVTVEVPSEWLSDRVIPVSFSSFLAKCLFCMSDYVSTE